MTDPNHASQDPELDSISPENSSRVIEAFERLIDESGALRGEGQPNPDDALLHVDVATVPMEAARQALSTIYPERTVVSDIELAAERQNHEFQLEASTVDSYVVAIPVVEGADPRTVVLEVIRNREMTDSGNIVSYRANKFVSAVIDNPEEYDDLSGSMYDDEPFTDTDLQVMLAAAELSRL